MVKKFVLLIVLFSVHPVFSQLSCSLGTAPQEVKITIFPGGEVVFPWSLFNYYGDRPTYVNISVSDTYFSVSSRLKNSASIVLYPNYSSTGSFVLHPTGLFPVPSEDVLISVKAPLNASSERFSVLASAYCFHDSGDIIPGIQAELIVNVQVVSREEYYPGSGTNFVFGFIIALGFLSLLVVSFLFLRKINNRKK